MAGFDHAAAIAAIAERVVNSSEPAAVARFVDRAGDEAAQLSGVVKKAVTAWCKQDEKAAKSWVATLDDPALKNSALLGLVYGNLKNPVEAARMLREEIEFEEGRTDPNIAGRLIIEMVPLGMEPQEIVDAFPESLRSDAAGRYADMYADRFPSKVLDFIKTQPMDGEMPYAIRKAVDRLYVEDSAAAIAWVEGADSEAHRKEAMATLVQSWAADDAAAATDWLAAQPDDSAKQAATAQLVESLQVSNPEQAFDLAREITNVRERDKALSSMIEEIARRDPAQAATMLDSAPLSPKALQNIEEQIATSRQLREALLNGNFNPGTQR